MSAREGSLQALRVGETMLFPELRRAEIELSRQLGRKVSARVFSSGGYAAVRDIRDVIAR